MSSSAIQKDQDLLSELEVDKSQSITNKAIIIGKEEFVKINLLNKLNIHFEYSVITKESSKDGIEYITQETPSLLIVDLDNFSHDSIDRLFSIVNYKQIPCLLISSDSSILKKIELENKCHFISFLPKSIINAMFKTTVHELIKKSSPTKKLEKRIYLTSSSEKPLYFYVLATLLFCEPLIKSLYLKFTTGFSWEILARTLIGIEGITANFEYWALFPIAAIALISVRSWSFFVFIGVQLYSIYSHLFYEEFTWPYVSENPQVSSIILIGMNVALVVYFLMPNNLRPYWNKTTSLWRNTTRIATKIPIYIKSQKTSTETTITNISQTGAYFTSEEELEIESNVSLDFVIDGRTKSISATIKRMQKTADDHYGYGVEFIFNNDEQKEHISRYIQTLGTKIQ